MYVNVNQKEDKRSEMFLKKGSLDSTGRIPGFPSDPQEFFQVG
jgi:hypothetical protein